MPSCGGLERRAQHVTIDARVVVQKKQPFVAGCLNAHVVAAAESEVLWVADYPSARIMLVDRGGRIFRRTVVDDDHLHSVPRVVERSQRVETIRQMGRTRRGENADGHALVKCVRTAGYVLRTASRGAYPLRGGEPSFAHTERTTERERSITRGF